MGGPNETSGGALRLLPVAELQAEVAGLRANLGAAHRELDKLRHESKGEAEAGAAEEQGAATTGAAAVLTASGGAAGAGADGCRRGGGGRAGLLAAIQARPSSDSSSIKGRGAVGPQGGHVGAEEAAAEAAGRLSSFLGGAEEVVAGLEEACASCREAGKGMAAFFGEPSVREWQGARVVEGGQR